jgi:glycogen debranching enzyme
MDDATAIPAADLVTEGVVLDRLLALKEGDTFLVADPWGDLRGGADGLFDRDSRILSRLVLLVGHDRPSRLSSAVSDDNVFFTCHATNRPLPPMGGRSAPGGVIHVERRRFLWDRRLYERVRLTNHGVDPIVAPLSFEYGADFRDIFEVRGTRRERRGQTRPPVADGGRVQFGYEGLDTVERQTWLSFSEPPAALSTERADFRIRLSRGEQFDLFMEAGVEGGETPGRDRWRVAALQARLAMRAKRRRGATVRGAHSPRFNQWLDQSRADVALLTTDLPTGPYPYAGVPWFSTPFGRDGIITAWQMLWLDPSLARGVLTYLAARQADETSTFQDSAPGKIMHETRQGEMSALKEVPFGLYYGGVDTTCLFVALAGAYARRTGDLAFIRKIWPNLLAAAGWMTDHGDSNGDGLIDYARAEDTGLSNQGWKDSEDSIFHADGAFPKGPIALLEVQGYAYSAWRALADLSALLGEGDPAPWSDRAERLRALVEDRFWMEDRGFYAIAVDGEGAPCRVLGSNAGHLLFSGLPSAERAGRVTERLLSGRFRTGWGLRTLASRQPRFNPMSYHNGSVWPHDTALGVAGMAHYGERDAVALMLGELYASAAHFEMRLPELFCGFNRQTGEPPIPYPVACMPQAWAAGSVFLMLQASLGLSIDALAGTIRIDRPCLPAGLDRLTVAGLAVGETRLDLIFQRVGSRVAVWPRHQGGPALQLDVAD